MPEQSPALAPVLAQCVAALAQLCQMRVRNMLEPALCEHLFIMWRLRAEIALAQGKGGGTPIG